MSRPTDGRCDSGAIAGYRTLPKERLADLLGDPSPAVRLQIADLILREQDIPAAWQVVDANLQPDTPAPRRLFAANIVADHASAPQPVLASLAALRNLKETYFGTMAVDTENYYARLDDTRARITQAKKADRCP